MEPLTVLAALMILVGIVGLVVPVLPGLAVTVAGVLVWALGNGSGTAWTVFGGCVLIAIAGWITQYAVPGRRMKAAGVPTSTLVAGAVCAIVGFFVIPVVGLFAGFVLGIYVIERVRLSDGELAWTRTKAALKGVLLSIGIELCAALLVAATFVVGLLITR